MADAVLAPLSQNLAFSKLAVPAPSALRQKLLRPSHDAEEASSSPWRLPLNLIAYDRCGRLFLWNSSHRLLHCVEIDRPEVASSSSSSSSAEASASEKASTLLSKKSFKVRVHVIPAFSCRVLLQYKNNVCCKFSSCFARSGFHVPCNNA
jgi:hypothetical protein